MINLKELSTEELLWIDKHLRFPEDVYWIDEIKKELQQRKEKISKSTK